MTPTPHTRETPSLLDWVGTIAALAALTFGVPAIAELAIALVR